jgi:hypothetical protein
MFWRRMKKKKWAIATGLREQRWPPSSSNNDWTLIAEECTVLYWFASCVVHCSTWLIRLFNYNCHIRVAGYT